MHVFIMAPVKYNKKWIFCPVDELETGKLRKSKELSEFDQGDAWRPGWSFSKTSGAGLEWSASI